MILHEVEYDHAKEHVRKGWVCPQCSASVAPHNDICSQCQTIKANENRIAIGKQILID
jgi:rubrerythrin